jgi:hypothetical protein
VTFYNTNAEEGAELAESRDRVQGQEDAVLRYFEDRPHTGRTRRDIEVIFHLPTQSATRALRNLTAAGRLEKSDATIRCESSGKAVHTWRLARKRPGRSPM